MTVRFLDHGLRQRGVHRWGICDGWYFWRSGGHLRTPPRRLELAKQRDRPPGQQIKRSLFLFGFSVVRTQWSFGTILPMAPANFRITLRMHGIMNLIVGTFVFTHDQ